MALGCTNWRAVPFGGGLGTPFQLGFEWIYPHFVRTDK